MTAHKIHIAVREHDVVNRASYRQIFWQFAGVYLLSLAYYFYMMVTIPGVMTLEWPDYL